MRLYGAIEKVEAQNDGTVRVYGIATSEAVDEQGEIVRAPAMRAAMLSRLTRPILPTPPERRYGAISPN